MWPFKKKDKEEEELHLIRERLQDLEKNTRKRDRCFKACSECGIVKYGSEFTREGKVFSPDNVYYVSSKTECHDCTPKVIKRNKAIDYATENPLAVLDCKRENE